MMAAGLRLGIERPTLLSDRQHHPFSGCVEVRHFRRASLLRY
jgi:hypothetical protein